MNFKKCKDPYDWEVGKHGTSVDFIYKDEKYESTFLPEVAKEEKWDKKETLYNLIFKALDSEFTGELGELD